MTTNDEAPVGETEASQEQPGGNSIPNGSSDGNQISAPCLDDKPLDVRWLPETFKSPPAEPEWLVDGLIRRGELVVLGAPRAFQKSWFVQNLAVAAGRGSGRFLGTFAIPRPARVLVCHGELDPWMAYGRWKLLVGDGEPPDNVGETFEPWRVRVVKKRMKVSDYSDGSRSEETIEYYDAMLDPAFEATIANYELDLVILDPWATYYAGEENSNDQMEAALAEIRSLSLKYGTAFVIVHHFGGLTGKNVKTAEPEDLWRGASRLPDWASTRITMLPHYDENARKNQGMSRLDARAYVDLKFLRRAEPVNDFPAKFNRATGWWEPWTTSGSTNGADTKHPTVIVDDVVAKCAGDGGKWSSERQAAKSLGVAAATAKKLLGAAVRAGKLTESDEPRGAKGYRVALPTAQ